jgi:predicted phage terminase large subunit-like protein
MKPPSQSEYDTLLRRSLLGFISHSFKTLNPASQLVLGWHLEVIADRLEACARGDIRRLIINLPPRHLKSLSASVAFPAWVLGHDPSKQILCVSYAQDLSEKLARETRKLMMDAGYKRAFKTRLSKDKQAAGEFETTAGGYRLATSVGGVLTGRGADLIIIDDPLKPEEALSDTVRARVNDWYDNTLYSRLNSKRDSSIILIMQRLHEDDLVGHVLGQEPWEVVSFPAIAEEDEWYEIETIVGRRKVGRRAGEVLQPEREPPHVLNVTRTTLGEYNFAGQYQQRPAPAGGGMIKAEWFRNFQSYENLQFDRIIQSWDTAIKPGELNDYSVCTTWGIKGPNLYLLDVLREKLDYPNLKRRVIAHFKCFPVSTILIEDRASGTQLIQELIYEGISNVQGVEPDGDKIMRMHAQTAKIENGFVYLLAEAPWRTAYLHELTTFPKGRYDDQVDSTSQALAWVREGQGAKLCFAALPRFNSRQREFEEYRRYVLRLPPGAS